MKSKKKGNGLVDIIKDPFGTVKEAFRLIPTKYNNVSRRTLETYGNNKINSLKIARTPLNKNLDGTINLMSFGKWNKIKHEHGYNQYYHISLIVNEFIIVEKLETITIEPLTQSKTTTPQTEYMNIHLNKNLTLNNMMDNAYKYMGDSNFWGYDSFENNCKDFIKSIMLANNLYSVNADIFLKQNLEYVKTDLKKSGYNYIPTVMHKITDIGSIASRLIGKGNQDIAMDEFDKYLLKRNKNFNNTKNISNEFINFINREGLHYI